MATLIELMLALLRDLVQASFRARAAIVAENLFLRRQLALYQERKVRRRRPTPAMKLALVTLGRFFPLAGRSGHLQAGDIRPLAPSRIPAVLGMEVQVGWSSTAAQKLAGSHRDDG